MGNDIPEARREQVKNRDLSRCFRCGGPGAEWHHRRSRSVRDEHRHCACNGVWLCRTCHRWAHANPFEARAVGLIVSRYQPQPGAEPAVARFGTLFLLCNGKFRYAETEQP